MQYLLCWRKLNSFNIPHRILSQRGFHRLRGRALYILILMLFMQLALGIPPTAAQARSEHEVILGTADNDIAMDMVVDSTGSVIVVGLSAKSQDPYVGMFYAVKVSPSGETLWTKSWNVTASDILTGVTVDSEDNILMIGACNFTTDQAYGIIYKFAPDGEELWSTEIDNINYVWYQTYHNRHCLDIQMHPASDDFFVVSSVHEGLYMAYVARYNASGSLVWRTEWYGPPESFGSIASLAWLSAENLIVISGLFYDDTYSWIYLDGQYLAAFDFDGNQVWNHTSYEPFHSFGESSAGFEFGPDQYIYATYAGRSMDHIVRGTYDFNETWSLDMIIDTHHSVYVTGFLVNGTDNLIGYGEVTTLIAGRAVIKSYQPAYQAPQPPQTLIFSFTADGELLWYDYLVIGRISDTCGCQFDADGRLIVAGYTSVRSFDTCDFYIVFGFVQTPFPIHYDDQAIFIFPIFNLAALCSAWGFERVRSGHSHHSPTSKPRLTVGNAAAVLFVSEFVLYGTMRYYLIRPYAGVGGPPPYLVYFLDWVTYFMSGLFYS
ncbi:MAG: hypothetical protein C4K48_01170, partial [Candidatus Thorarchaeota archaeon]